MPKHREIELKLTLAPEHAQAILAHPLLREGFARGRVKTLRAVYFDTPDARLRRGGFVLRLRRGEDAGEGEARQTLKTAAGAAAGLFRRGEWEWTIAGEAPDLGALAETPAAAIVAEPGFAERLAPAFTVESTRRATTLADEDARIEIVVDEGVVRGADAEAAFCEIELELKQGKPRDLFRVARALAADAPLRLGFEAKSDRGHALAARAAHADRAGGGVGKFEAGLAPAMNVREAFQAIARACLRQLAANEEALARGPTAGAIHQMRVAIRRLRAAMSLFRKAVDDKERTAVAEGLRRVARSLGEARDLDVFIANEIDPMREKRPDDADAERLAAHFARQRDAAYAQAREAIDGAPHRLAALDALAWVETGRWRKNAACDDPAFDFAAKTLARRSDAIRKRARRLSSLSVEERHALRIAVKKLRYAAEFFAPLFSADERGGKRAARFVKALAALQDRLGELNDAATAISLTGSLDRNDAAQMRAARLIDEDRVGRAAASLAAARKAAAGFARAKPFWE